MTTTTRLHLSESYDQVTYANLLDEVKQTICNVEEMTAVLSEKETEVNEAEVYVNVSDARSWQIKLMSRIHFLESFSANANANVNVNNVVPKKKPGRLPEVKLNVFKGNFEEWETFWSSFRANVDVRDNLEKTTKFIYLVQSLEGEPKEMMSGLANGTTDRCNATMNATPTTISQSLPPTTVVTQTQEGEERDEGWGEATTTTRLQRRAARQQRALLGHLIRDDQL